MTKIARLRDQLYMLQGSRCFYCDRAIAPNDRSLEHIIADSIGGYANDENAVVVCQDANHLLGDASPKRKMMMLKAGGGRIECPKQGSCAKAGQPGEKHNHENNPSTPSQQAPAHKPSPIQVAQNNAKNSQNQGRNGNNNGRHNNGQAKSKKKQKPHLKGSPSVH